jgi:hypothetical protein
VLVGQSAEAVAALNCGVGVAGGPETLRGLRRSQFERSVRALAVVVLDVLAGDAFELTFAHDQQRVEALLA